MPPFTYDPIQLFAAIATLANERDQSHRWCRRGTKRPAFDVEHAKAQRKANLKARQLAAADRTNAAARKRNHTARPVGEDIQSRMLRAMEPGSWYGMGDLVRLIGEAKQSRGKEQGLLKQGWVESALNPQWDGQVPNRNAQPRRLYRLTTKGLARRAALDDIVPPAA